MQRDGILVAGYASAMQEGLQDEDEMHCKCTRLSENSRRVMTRNVRTRNEHVAAAVKEAVVRVQALGLQPAVRLRHIMHTFELKLKGMMPRDINSCHTMLHMDRSVTFTTSISLTEPPPHTSTPKTISCALSCKVCMQATCIISWFKPEAKLG